MISCSFGSGGTFNDTLTLPASLSISRTYNKLMNMDNYDLMYFLCSNILLLLVGSQHKNISSIAFSIFIDQREVYI